MKKLMIFAAAGLFLMAASSAALACGINGTTWTKIDTVCTIGTTGTMEVKGSKSVSMAYKAQTTGRTYTIGTVHGQGNKGFASSSGDQKIFWTPYDGATNPVIPAEPSGTAGADWANWTAM